MAVVRDLIFFLMKKTLPKDILKNPQRILGMYLFIDELKTLLDQSLNEEAMDCNLTINECSDLMKTFYDTSKGFDLKHIAYMKEFDLKIIDHMIEISTTFEDVMQIFAVGLHYRKNKDYAGIIAIKLAKKNLPHKVWFKLLTYKDPWFFRISNSIEKIVLIKTFETTPDAEVIIRICNDYAKKMSFSFNILLTALSETNMSVDNWKEIRSQSVRKEIKKIADEKINQLRVGKNHQLD